MGRIATSREDREISERLARQIEEHAVEKPARWTYEYALETGNSNGNQPGGIPAGLIHEAAGKFSSVPLRAAGLPGADGAGERGSTEPHCLGLHAVEYIVPSRSDSFHPVATWRARTVRSDSSKIRRRAPGGCSV